MIKSISSPKINLSTLICRRMRALIIEPSTSTITLKMYEPIERFFPATVQSLLGEGFSYAYEFPNGDGLFLVDGSLYDTSNYAFVVKRFGIPMFGNAVVIGVSKVDRLSIQNCRFTLASLRQELQFYDKETTETIRRYEMNEP